MFKLITKPSVTQKVHSSSTSQLVLTQPNRGSLASDILMLQRIIGNQAVQKVLQDQGRNANARDLVQKSLAFGHDFSRIPVHHQPTSANENLAMHEPGDKYEQEADRVAEQVMSMSEPKRSDQRDAASQATVLSHGSAGQTSSGGRPLDAETRQFFESRFGHSFATVRVHADHAAHEYARNLQAHAYSIGNNITFGTGEYQASTRQGRRLLAHELAHVVQQSHVPDHSRSHALAASLSRIPYHAVQRKLIATGDPAGFAALANSVIAVQQEVVVSPAGLVSLRSTNVQGPPTPAAHELISVLTTVINDSNTTTIEFIHGTSSTRASDSNVIVGNYSLSRIDLDDISAFGLPSGRGLNAGTALAHEILEQQRKQVRGESYPVAHAAGLAAEARAAGATITPGPLRQINATTIEIKDIYTYPDRTREEVTIVITNGNVTNVTRRTLP